MVELQQLALDANAGSIDALYQMGEAHRLGVGVARNLPSAMRCYLKAATRGHVAAQVSLGRLYMQDFEPVGLERNVEQARYWLKRAAAAGSVQAAYLSAKLMLEDDSPLFDAAGAIQALEAAAASGSGSACNDLAILYLAGEVIPRNAPRAHVLLLRGAQLGDAHAQYNLARCYADGESVEADGESVGADAAQAEYWFGEALARGVAEARLPLALLLLSHQPAEERRPRGLKLLIAAADGGDADAQYELARRLESGVGDAPDLLRALHYYHEASNADHAEALFKLATIFHRGIDLDRAYPERAAPLFRRLAEEHAHGYAAQILGVMHAQGNGVPRDLPRAERLFQLASRLGQNDALLNLALLRAGPSEHHDLVEAAKWAILFDGCAASEESHELMRTLFELLDDDRIVEAEKRAQSWSAESEAHRDVVTVTMARGGVVPANAGTQSIREQSIIAGPRLSPG